MEGSFWVVSAFIILIVVGSLILANLPTSEEKAKSLTLSLSPEVDGKRNITISQEYPKVVGTLTTSESSNHLIVTANFNNSYKELNKIIGNLDIIHFIGEKGKPLISTSGHHALALSEEKCSVAMLSQYQSYNSSIQQLSESLANNG